jgi:hypothetical protein
VRSTPAGWTFGGANVRNGWSKFTLDDVVSSRQLVVRLTAACDTTGAGSSSPRRERPCSETRSGRRRDPAVVELTIEAPRSRFSIPATVQLRTAAANVGHGVTRAVSLRAGVEGRFSGRSRGA